jgi:uncharacterized LabA/DUF88 family protein
MGVKKAALYVDGFNFYYGVRNHFKAEQARRGYSLSGLCWCDFRALIERHFLAKGYELGPIRYFTAPVTESVETTAEEHERYELWLRAARTIRGLEVIRGFHKRGREGKGREEKETDVNLAVELVLDGLRGVYDRAYVLSGDTDQIPSVLAAAFRLPQPKCVSILLPPSQTADDWKKHYCEAALQLKEREGFRQPEPFQVEVGGVDQGKLMNSLLRYELEGVSCPAYWRVPGKVLEAECRRENRPEG